MDRIVIENGGMPFHGSDLLFMQTSLITALEAIASAPSDNYILSGCIPDLGGSTGVNTPIDITPGYVVLNREILYFEGGQYIINGSPLPGGGSVHFSFKLDVSYDPDGLDIYADGVARDTYQLRRAICTAAEAENQIIVNNAPRYEDVVKTKIGINNGGISELELLGAYTGSASVLKIGSIVFLELAVSSGTTNSIICQLPFSFRPTNDIYTSVTFKDGSIGALDDAKAHITEIGQVLVKTGINTALPSTEVAYINLQFIVD